MQLGSSAFRSLLLSEVSCDLELRSSVEENGDGRLGLMRFGWGLEWECWCDRRLDGRGVIEWERGGGMGAGTGDACMRLR